MCFLALPETENGSGMERKRLRKTEKKDSLLIKWSPKYKCDLQWVIVAIFNKKKNSKHI